MELKRLGIETCPDDQAASYRNKVKKMQQAQQKAEEKRKINIEKDKIREPNVFEKFQAVPKELMRAKANDFRHPHPHNDYSDEELSYPGYHGDDYDGRGRGRGRGKCGGGRGGRGGFSYSVLDEFKQSSKSKPLPHPATSFK